MGRTRKTGRVTARGKRPAADQPRAAGPWLRSKAGQLAEYLRRAVEHGELAEPLPGSRQWSRQLGVSRRVLTAAVDELQREGWLTVHPRGVRLHAERTAKRARGGSPVRVVRLLLFAAYRRYIHGYFETISSLQEQLRLRGFELKWESCPPARLRAIARQPASAHELIVLASVPPVYQRLFAVRSRAVVALGEVAPGVDLPYITGDQVGAVRHATFRLLQRGFREVVLVHIDVEAAGIKRALAAFEAAIAAWTRGPVTGRRVATALDQASLAATARRLATGIRGRTGIIVVAPVPVSLVVTALWSHGIAVPADAEVVALFHTPEAIKLYPPPAHYPSPVGRIVQQLTAVAEQYFDTGRLPRVAKTIGVELAEA